MIKYEQVNCEINNDDDHDDNEWILINSVIAIVTFAIPSEAKRAFNHLSYRKYQHTPLYLEYLPIDLWNDSM